MAAQDEPETDRPYTARKGRLPRHLDEVTPAWLTGLLANRYPGIVVESMDVVEVKNSHTTKLRLALELNDVGREAGVPRNVCLKSNWSEGFESGDICELEARFYYFMRDQLSVPLPGSYYADWDGDGGGRGIVVMEDLGTSPGQFGNSTHHLGVDGVARALESLARLHGAQGVLDQDAAWEQFRRWPVYGMQSWAANQDAWGQSSPAMVECFFTAAEDLDTIGLLTRGKTPWRKVELGEGARAIASGLLPAQAQGRTARRARRIGRRP